MSQRPFPPPALSDPRLPLAEFRPAPELAEWVRETFLGAGPLSNPDHQHLDMATIGYLWTGVDNVRGGRRVVGTAEVFRPKGGKWQIARQEQQLRGWFGTDALDFIVTLDAGHAAGCSDLEFCALVEHELYHCGQKRDRYGTPMFSRTGMPLFALRAHDAEEFVGVVRRYGIGGAAGGVRELVEAAARAPEVGAVKVAGACGTCLKAVA